MNPIIIIGSGLAGYTLAKELRKLDQNTPLQIITADSGNFYSKPLLSTALANARTPSMLVMADANSMAKQLNAEIITHTHVTAIDPQQTTVFTPQKKYPYSKLVLACGADVIPHGLSGDGIADIFAVNNLEMYEQWHEFIQEKKRIVILGAGLVGCEFANDLLAAGYQVEVVAPCEFPLPNLLPQEFGKILKDALTAAGIVWHLNETATQVQRDKQGCAVKLSSNKIIYADAVISAIGLRPKLMLAKTAGLTVNRGIVVNRQLQTNVEQIYALGDCVEVNGFVLLFIAPLLHCARALANTLSGKPTAVSYPPMPIVLKTPSCPVVIAPPAKNIAGHWYIEGDAPDIRALCFDKDKKQLLGFILIGNCIREKAILTKQLPEIF